MIDFGPGMKFGKWLVISRSQEKTAAGAWKWVARCDCGRERLVDRQMLVLGKSTQCQPCARTTHGLSKTRASVILAHMKQRCFNPKTYGYEHYGGRGITISPRWMRLENFVKDMGEPPSLQHEIDRIDVNGNYEPGNCRWVLPRENQRNKTTTRFIEWNGKIQCASDWSRETGISLRTILRRLNSGWSAKDVLTTKPLNRGAAVYLNK